MNTLYRKLSIATVMILVASTVVGFIIANVVYYGSTKGKVDAQSAEVAEEIATTLAQYEKTAYGKQYLQSVGEMGYQIQLMKGQEILSFGKPFTQQQVSEKALQQVENGEVYHGIEEFDGKYFLMAHFSNDVQNTIGIPVRYNGETYAMFVRQDNNVLFSDMHMMLWSFLVGIVFVSLLGVFLMTRKLLKPILQLTEATKAVTKANYNYPIHISRNDEIGELATSFQLMQQQLAHNIEARNAFISNVSHDFQSPLMNIQGYASLLQTETTIDGAEYAAIIEQEAKRLSILTKQLLLLTSLEQANRPVQRVEVALHTQLRTIIRNHLWRADEKDIELSYELEEVCVNGDEELLYIVFDNILDNALKYTQSGGDVTVRAYKKDGYAYVEVEDTGIGLTAEQQSQVFERFYRVDVARKKGGTGLGLAIAKEIVQQHEGTIMIVSTFGHGTTFQTQLPANEKISSSM